MANIDDVFNSLQDEAFKFVKDELKGLLTSAKNDADSIVKETGKKISEWLVLRAQGKLSNDELEALLYSRDQLLRQYKNTLEIHTRARVEKIAVGLINLVLDKILGLPFGK